MNTPLIIYLIGSFLMIVSMLFSIKRKHKFVTVGDLIMVLCCSIVSWAGVILIVIAWMSDLINRKLF